MFKNMIVQDCLLTNLNYFRLTNYKQRDFNLSKPTSLPL